MGLLGKISGADQAKKSASKAAKNQLQAIQEQRNILNPAYQSAMGRIDPTYQALQGIYGNTLNQQLGGFQGAYDTGVSALTGGRDAGLAALGSAYGTGRADLLGAQQQAAGALQQGYGATRADVGGSLAAQLDAINQARAAGIGYYQPYMTAGEAGLGRATAMTTPGDTSFQADPGYQWRLAQGIQGIQGSAAGKGGVLGGNTLKALETYGQGLGSQEFGNIYNRNLGLAQLGLGASQGAAGLQQWGGGATAAANQWAGNQNVANNQWLGSGLGTLYANTGQNLANLGQQYGMNQANLYDTTGRGLATLGQWNAANQGNVWGNYGNNLAGTEQWRTGNLNAMDLGRAQEMAGLAGNAGDVAAARESAQGQANQANNAFWRNVLSAGIGGTVGYYGGSNLLNNIGTGINAGIGLLGGGQNSLYRPGVGGGYQ